jgi:hypothetical protein
MYISDCYSQMNGISKIDLGLISKDKCKQSAISGTLFVSDHQLFKLAALNEVKKSSV